MNESRCERVALVMHTLKKGVQWLCDYYAGLGLGVTVPNELHLRFFPSVRAFLDEGRVVKFKYHQPFEDHPSCVTFLARTLEDSPKLIAVKIVQRHGADAHRLLARQKMGPQLLYYGNIGDGDLSYGPLRMVVMEDIEGTTLDKAKRLGRVPGLAKGQVEAALKHLHDAGLSPSECYDQKVRLIDFDWAGILGESRYPLFPLWGNNHVSTITSTVVYRLVLAPIHRSNVMSATNKIYRIAGNRYEVQALGNAGILYSWDWPVSFEGVRIGYDRPRP